MSPSRRPYAYLGAYYSVLVCVGIVAACLGPALGNLAAASGNSLQGVSVLLALRPGGYMLGTLLSGRLLDRVPGHPFMAWGVALAVAMLAFIPFTHSLALLGAAVFLLGLADGMMDVGANTLLPWVFGEKSGPYFNGLHFAFGLGAFATPILMAKAGLWSGDWRASFWLLALLLTPLLPLLLRLPSPSHAPSRAGNEPEPSLGGTRKLALICAGAFFFYGGTEAAWGNWIFSYARARGLADEQGAAALNSTFWGCLALGRLAGVPIAMRVPFGRILAVDCLGATACLGLVLAFPDSLAALWAGSAGAGLFLATIFPTLLGWAGRSLSPSGRVTGALTAFFFVGSSTGSIALPWLIGQGFERLGSRSAPAVVFAGSLLMSGGLFWLFQARAKKILAS